MNFAGELGIQLRRFEGIRRKFAELF